jgi:hypothetical protein
MENQNKKTNVPSQLISVEREREKKGTSIRNGGMIKTKRSAKRRYDEKQ